MFQVPKISIVCTTYNHEDYISKTLQGFVNQTIFKDCEIVIHDDASSDRTQAILLQFQCQYPEQVHLILQKDNQYSQGVSITDTYILSETQGEYIALCEGDDYWCDDKKLELQIEYMESHPQCVLCGHSAHYAYENGKILQKKFRAFKKDTNIDDYHLIMNWCFPTASIVYRKAARWKERPECIGYAPCGDYPLALYLMTKGECHYMDRIMSVYRLNSKSSLSRALAESSERRTDFYIKMKKFLKAFDEFTEEKYHLLIQRKLEDVDMRRCIAVNDYATIRKCYRNIYHKLPLKTRLHLSIKQFKNKIQHFVSYKMSKSDDINR